MMLTMVKAQEDIACAASLVKPFLQSKKKRIAVSSLAMFVGFTDLGAQNKKMLGMLKSLLNTRHLPPTGTRYQMEAHIQLAMTKDWDLILGGVTSAVLAARAEDPTTKTMSNTVLTPDQRSTLADKFQGIADRAGTRDDIQRIAAAVATSLRDPKVKSVPAPTGS